MCFGVEAKECFSKKKTMLHFVVTSPIYIYIYNSLTKLFIIQVYDFELTNSLFIKIN